MPALDLRDTKGNTWTLASLPREKPVLIEFWATWCTTCRAMAPMLKNIYRDRAAGSWDYVTISIDTDLSALTKYIEAERPAWPVLLDRKGSASKAWKVKSVPAFFIVKNGVIQAKWEGKIERKALELALIKAAMN